ncbi:exodeoxyribonuclease VII small subunit [Gammaproteobacteria bacterium]|nr:exodeoxyribonuclease VII small subunit [Gammaproteobacteria bacterium]
MGVVENNKNKIEVERLSFEEALLELEEIVGNLEQGANKLDDAIEAYERGTLLKKHCESKLSEAKARIEKITVGSNGNPTAEPVDL